MKGKKDKPNLAIPVQKLFPNMITILGLCLGISAIRYSIDFKMQIAAGLIVIAALMDGLDGKIARLLNGATPFGAHLDSLADIVSFGVAPAVVIYIWSLHEIPMRGIGWAVVLFYVTCSALRLARFNVQNVDKTDTNLLQHYLVGVPMPAAASLALTPMLFTFELVDFKFPAWFIALYILIIGILMVSRIPTFSFNKVNIKRKYVTFILLTVSALIAGTVLEPWIILPFIALLYLLSIPCSIFIYSRNKNTQKNR